MDNENKGETQTEKKKRKYVGLSIREKCRLIVDIEGGMLHCEAARKYNVRMPAITYILKGKDKYLHAERCLVKRRRVDKGQHPVMEFALVEWIKEKRSQGIMLTGPMIREKALMLNEELINTQKEADEKIKAEPKEAELTESGKENKEGNGESSKLNINAQNFKASDGWLTRFKARHGLRETVLAEEKLPVDTKTAEDAWYEIRQFLVDNGYSLDNVYNAAETGLFHKSLPDKALAYAAEEYASGFEENKERVTIMNCANATGSHKIPLLMIEKSDRPRCFLNTKVKLPVNYASQSRSWMTGELFVEWYTTVFITSVKARKPGEYEKFLLILDNAPCHPPEEELEQIDRQFRILYPPRNMPYLIQPMSQGIIESMKRNYKKIFLRRMLDEKHRNIVNFVENWTLTDTAFALSSAWNNVPEVTISKCWKKLLGNEIPVAKVFDPIVTDVTGLLNSVTSSKIHSNEDVEAWLQSEENLETCTTLTDKDITENASCVKIENSEFDDSQPAVEDAESRATVPRGEKTNTSNAQEAYKHFLRFRDWCEENVQCSRDDIERLNQMQDFAEQNLFAFMATACEL